MSVKASELPDLIAAAVKKSIADQQLTNEDLAAVAHRRVTIGIIAAPQQESGTPQREALRGGGESIPSLNRPIGFVLNDLDELRNLGDLKTEEEK